MKLSSFFKALVGGVLALLLIGVSGCNSPDALFQGRAAGNPAAAIFVPKQAAVMVSLLVNPDRLEDFSHGNRGRARQQLDKIKQSLLADTDLDYRRDIQPWLGNEITLAVTTLDIDRNGQNGKQPGYLLAVTTKAPDKSRDFVELFWQKRAIAGKQLVYEQYQGVNLIYSDQSLDTPSVVKKSKVLASPSLQNSVASAVVGDRFILFANSPKVLRDAINNVQAANLSLNDAPSYQLALQNLISSRIGLSFVNLPTLTRWIGSRDANADSLAQQPYQVAIALSPQQQGLLADTALLAASGQEIAAKPPTLSAPVGALQYIPTKSGIALAGTNLHQLWNQLSSGLQRDDTLSQLLQSSVATLSTRWGIQLPQDIFSWVQGEYALALLPRPEGNPDWIFVADRSVAATAEESIEYLDAVAKRQGFSVGSLPLEGQTISAWTKLTTATGSKKAQESVTLKAQVRGVHTTAGKYEIFATSIEAIDQALKATDNSLITSDKFKQVIAALPQPNDGFLYLDWKASQSFLEGQLPIVRVVELIGQPLFANLRSLTLSSYGSEAGFQRSKLFLQLGTVPTP